MMLASAAMLTVKTAAADPWIPAAGHGTVKPMVRLYSADRSFSASGFGTNTKLGSKLNVNQFRVVGVTGLGHDLSFEYDLRLAQARSSRGGVTSTNTGLQDQEVGLNYGLTQTLNFADSVGLNVILPTAPTKPVPPLGAGRWAIEPDAQFGLKHGPATLTVIAGPRFFVDGNAVQLRTEADLSMRATPRLTFTGTVFFVSTLRKSPVLPIAASGEDYNLLRLGIFAEYRITSNFRPFIGFEQYIAGKNGHAGQRVTLGVAIHF
jgi:hypothetical protein